MAANEHDLRVAIVAIAEADNGAGGVATLTAKPHPLVRWGDKGARSRPITTLYFPRTRYHNGSKDLAWALGRFDVFAPPGSGGLEDRIADRFEVILTATAFADEDLDVAPFLRTRGDQPELDEGGQRKQFDIEFLFNRS